MASSHEMLSLEMYAKAIEGSDSGLWVLDIPWGICYLSHRYYTMLGYEPGEFEGTMDMLFEILHPDDVDHTNRIMQGLMNGQTDTYKNEVRLKTKSGSYLYILTQGLAERDETGAMVKLIGWNIDISPLKEAQRKLDEERTLNISQSGLAQIGLFSGGISHEINNPLTVIQLRVEKLLSSLQKGEDIDREVLIKNLDFINEAGKRIGAITKGLNTIAGSGKDQQRETLRLTTITEEVLKIWYSSLTKQNVAVKSTLTDADTNIFVNATLLSQVLINLIKNASEAVEHNKVKEVSVEVYSDSTYAFFKITDNGKGISKKDADKIMLPFYSTKKSTGLGLSIAQSVIQSQNGVLSFESKPGKTTFLASFPLAN